MNRQARKARDAGIRRAVEHAEEVHQGWAAQAVALVEDYAGTVYATDGGLFTAEDIREYAKGSNLPEPPHARSWGGVMRSAAAKGIIRKCGITESQAPHCHCSHVGLWEVA